MATMNVFLSDPMKDWVEAQTRSGRYSDAGDYVRDLIRRDQARADMTVALQRSITEGLESGVSDRSLTQVLDMARRQAGTAQEP